MAATVQQHRATNANNTANRTNNTATNNPNPQLKRLVYSKYRELLGSYNDQANAYIDTLPSYMVQKDTGFNLEMKNNNDFVNSNTQNSHAINNNQNEMYGAGQRMPSQQTYEAPACVQNAMMTKDKKPFTYTPGGIDLSQIKSERMAKRLARNAQAEGATGIQQQNRPTQPQSPSSTSPNGTAAAAMGAAAMGMPFQVLPPPPPPAPASGKNFNGGSTPAPPPPPPSSSNFSKTGTLAPPSNGNDAVGRGSTPNSPSMPRKSPTPQRFEPPPMGFRPEIKIPPNPMASLRKVPTPVEKNNFWKDEYVKDRSKSPMVDIPNTVTATTNNYNSRQNDSVNSASSSSPQTTNANYNGTAILNNDNIDGLKKPMPTTTTNNVMQQNQTNNNFTNHEQTHTPNTPFNSQQSPLKPLQHAPQYGGCQTPLTPLQQNQIAQQSPLQQQQTPKPEFRSVAAPTSPAVNVYTRQTDSPRTLENATPPRATESPFKFAQQQQQQYQQQRAPPAVSPLAQQSTPSSASSGASVSPNNNLPGQTVPWRTQRGQTQQQPSAVAQSHNQPIYNNVQQQQPRTSDFNTQQSAYQGPKPTNIGSLYIAPLAPPSEPQAQHIVRQQMQQHQQQQQRDSPIRQMTPQQQQQPNQQLRWMSTQPMTKEQPAWARPEENGNVVPSSLNRIKSPPPSLSTAQAQQSQQQQHNYQTLSQGNGFAPQNFGAQPINTTGLHLQINTPVNQSNNQTGPKERIIPIQLEQTPTYTSAQPSFNQTHQPAAGSIPPAPGYVMRTPNQFVDQGYNNFGQQQQPPQPQRIMSPTLQQLNAPRMVQQTQNNIAPANKTHIIPIAIENNEALRGPLSKTPIVIQNDQRTPPVQSKSFRILQKITDTIDDSNNDDQANQQQQQQPIEPQLQRPTFARQMSAQQARHSPTVEQMKRMQIGHEQGNYSAPATPSAIKYNNQQQQRSFYDNNSQQYVPPSEQQAPEPKKYTGSAIPSRSFKILQAMTQPENAEKPEICQKNNEMNEIESKPESNRHSSCSCNSSGNEPPSSSSSTSLNSELNFSSSPSPSLMQYPPYQYPYVYPWYPPPTHFMSTNQSVENYVANNWPYPYVMPSNITSSLAAEHATPYPPYAYYYPYYPLPRPAHMSPLHVAPPNQNNNPNAQSTEYDFQNICMPPPPPYLAYPYPVVPSYSQSSSSSRASSVLPDIIITPSTDDMPSKVIMQHHIKVEKERSKRASSLKLEDVTALKMKPITNKGSAVDILTHQLENMGKCTQNNFNTKCQTKKPYEKNFTQKSPENNSSLAQVNLTNIKLENGSHNETNTDTDTDTDTETSDSEITPKLIDSKEPNALKSIKSVNNIQIYNGQARQQQIDSDFSCDDETTADGESEIFDAEDEEEEQEEDFELPEDSLEQEGNSICEEYLIDDNLSVIYEEESEMEKSSLVAKTTATADDKSSLSEELPLKINNNEKYYNSDDEKDDSTSVTVRLPLKFSFSSTKNAENVTTLEVGKSQIRENITNPALNEKRNTFNVASIKSDTEDDDDVSSASDGCDVSVTISLTHSSKSSLVDEQVNNESANKLYPIDDISITEEEIKSSQEDVSVSFSLNMRNKFSKETNTGNITNNIAEINDATPIEQVEKLNEAPEEMDFFATLRATKMQAQKIKEQSANYWGKMADDKFCWQQEMEQTHSEQQQVLKEETQKRARTLEDNKETKKSKLILKKKCSKPKIETETGNEAKIGKYGKQETKAKKLKESKAENSNCNTHKNECESKAKIKKLETNKSKTLEKCSFWEQENKNKKQEGLKLENVLETKEDHTPNVSLQQPKELEKTLDLKMKETVEVTNKFLIANADNYSHSEASDTTHSVAHEAEEIVDIWADREEELPPIKPIKSKLHTLETARNSFWSSVYETEKQTEKERISLQSPETITKVAFNLNALRAVIKAVAQPQAASVSYEAEYINHQGEDAKDVDFWQEIEQPREFITPQPPHIAKAFNWEAETTANDSVLGHTFGEQESSFYSDDNNTDDGANDKTTTHEQFNPFKYPEEPREVDTDEEIDFWAEIEAKRQAEEDDVTFRKSASFWASRERENFIDETPYKPVLPKAFHAKLPDEQPTEDINIWQTLEVHKGEEPIIIDPVVEEEKALVLEYDQMMQLESIEEQHTDDAVSVHEPVAASVWCPQAQINPQVEEKQMISQDIRNSNPHNSITDFDELEVKRNNYRKAMVFFTTSIDENKEQMVDRYERSKSKSNRAYYIEEETEQWDWDAVSEALQEEKPADNQETFAKEETPQTTLCCKSFTEALPLPEVYAASTKKRLANGLPDLEVQKFIDERKISVKDRISAFETGAVEQLGTDSRRNSINKQSLSVESSTRQNSLSRNSSTQRSESEMDEDDSGVTDMNKQLSETDTESESFPELRKMSSYQRASTHSRLFKLLQDDPDVTDSQLNVDEFQFKPSRRRIVHNVSITRKQNPNALAEAETMSHRRERLSLPLRKNTSIDNDNPSTPNSPASPIMGQTANKSTAVSDKLVSELVQSLLLRSESTQFRKLPMEKLQAAAKKVLEEELESLDNNSLDATPATTPCDLRKEKTYTDYYNTWSDALGAEDIVPSKSFKALQDSRRSSWTARCPRVLSSKTINRDLARVTESPEISMHNIRQSRETSIGKWKKS